MKKAVLFIVLAFLLAGCSNSYGKYRLDILDAGFKEGCCPFVFGGELYYSVSDSAGMDYLVHERGQMLNKGYARIDMTTLRVFSDGTVMFVGYNPGGDGVIVSNNPEVTDVGDEERDFRDVADEYAEAHELLVEQKPDSRGCVVVNEEGNDIVDYSRTWYVSCNGERKSQSYGFVYEDSVMWAGDKLAFTAENGLNDRFVVYDGQEIGSGVFKFIGNMAAYKGSIVFDADTKRKGPYHVYLVAEK